jgi:hypothetical protein
MKRLLFSLSAIFCIVGLSAQTYNISNLYPSATATPESVGNFTVLNSDNSASVIVTPRTFDGVEYTTRLRLNGSVIEDSATGLPTSRAIAIPYDGSGSFEVAVLPVGLYGSIESVGDSLPSNQICYTLQTSEGVTKGATGVELGTANSSVQKWRLEASDSGTIYLYSTGGGLNIYMIKYTADNATAINRVDDCAVVSSEYFSISGIRADVPSQGIYIRRDRLADGSTRAVKVVVR